jgi:hypothetical protein
LVWKYCSNDEYSALYSSHNPQIYLAAKAEIPRHSLLSPIDWRCAGLHLWASFSTGWSFPSVWEALTRRPPEDVVVEDGGLIWAE